MGNISAQLHTLNNYTRITVILNQRQRRRQRERYKTIVLI